MATPTIQRIQPELRAHFEAVLAQELGGKTFDNELCKVWREAIAKECTERLKQVITASGEQFMYSLTVMVFEKAGFNRALSTMLRKTDGLVSAEYRGDSSGSKVYGLVDAVLIKL
eukprot:c16399_g1_i1.p1 GENE.c16399_g1_i1~~c16399_g1_i1.p1  ORF type:complete len:115 (-),score=7.93 c16399_g1_i1:100-444(-)